MTQTFLVPRIVCEAHAQMADPLGGCAFCAIEAEQKRIASVVQGMETWLTANVFQAENHDGGTWQAVDYERLLAELQRLKGQP